MVNYWKLLLKIGNEINMLALTVMFKYRAVGPSQSNETMLQNWKHKDWKTKDKLFSIHNMIVDLKNQKRIHRQTLIISKWFSEITRYLINIYTHNEHLEK